MLYSEVVYVLIYLQFNEWLALWQIVLWRFTREGMKEGSGYCLNNPNPSVWVARPITIHPNRKSSIHPVGNSVLAMIIRNVCYRCNFCECDRVYALKEVCLGSISSFICVRSHLVVEFWSEKMFQI